MFNYGMIDNVYDMMYEEAVSAEKTYMSKVKNILKRKEIKSEIDEELLATNNGERFFELLLNGYNNTQASATTNALAGTYTVNIDGKSTTYTASGTDKTKIDEYVRKNKLDQAAGYLFELAAKPILTNMLTQLGKGIENKYNDTKFVHHADTYTHDYEIYYSYTTTDSLDQKGGYLFPIEEKARIDNFHVANAKNDGILDVSDYTRYLNQDPEQDGYDVYEYIKMKLIKEKLKNNYPIFHSVNSKHLGVLLSSTMLNKSYNFYLQNKKIPSDEQILDMAKQIVGEESELARTDLTMYSPYVNTTLSSLRQNDSEMQKFTKTILQRVTKNAAKQSGIKGFSLWYGKRF